MSTFEVPVVKITKVEDHPNADRLSLVYFREFITISAKLEDGSHRYKAGDLVVYVPEGSVVPEYLLRQGFWDEKNNKGILAGSFGDRVKAIRLRGILSQGIMFPTGPYNSNYNELHRCVSNDKMFHPVKEGDNVAEFLGIAKWEPPIPASMAGELESWSRKLPHFDVENIKKFPDVLQTGEHVVITEKLHGTMFCLAHSSRHPDRVFMFSKGLGARHLIFKNSEENFAKNIYLRTVYKKYADCLKAVARVEAGPGFDVFLFGEVYGAGVQDLNYGSKEPTCRIFDIAAVDQETDAVQWAPWDAIKHWATLLDVETVPVLYEGPWNPALREQFRDGKSTLADHIREGIVIRPFTSRETNEGRVIFKDVSEAYLTRKGGTEYN